jgi:hypothetical protein
MLELHFAAVGPVFKPAHVMSQNFFPGFRARRPADQHDCKNKKTEGMNEFHGALALPETTIYLI